VRYVALLRGINVGGHGKVEMPRLKDCFDAQGFKDVSTFTNLGNVFFETSATNRVRMVKKIEHAIEREIGFRVPVVLRTGAEIARVVKAVPKGWVTDQRMRCDIMFLWPDVDSRSVLKGIPSQPDVEDLKYVPGALVWRIDRAHIGKSKVRTVIGSKLYKNLTIRNINTVRKLNDLLRTKP
jgi:uncharacterized protein (DUF1697 family)